MEAPQDEDEEEKPGVKHSIKKLKERFLPGVKYTLLISLVVNFAMLVVGSLNVHYCPVNTYIPLFLIATGAVGLMSKFVTYIKDRIKFMEVKYVITFLYVLETILCVCGAVWVYKVFKPSYNNQDKLYCNKTTYLFAFIYITITIAIAIAMFLGFLCFICTAYLLARKQHTNYDPEAQIGTGNQEGPATYLTRSQDT